MLSRVMQLSPILLLTLNIWAGCCCIGSACESVSKNCSEQTEMVELKTSCHLTNDRAKMASSEQPNDLYQIKRACECGNCQSVTDDYFALPSVEEFSVSAPLIIAHLERAEFIQPDEQFRRGVLAPFLVSDRLAPRLSVLARFLI